MPPMAAGRRMMRRASYAPGGRRSPISRSSVRTLAKRPVKAGRESGAGGTKVRPFRANTRMTTTTAAATAAGIHVRAGCRSPATSPAPMSTPSTMIITVITVFDSTRNAVVVREICAAENPARASAQNCTANPVAPPPGRVSPSARRDVVSCMLSFSVSGRAGVSAPCVDMRAAAPYTAQNSTT